MKRKAIDSTEREKAIESENNEYAGTNASLSVLVDTITLYSLCIVASFIIKKYFINLMTLSSVIVASFASVAIYGAVIPLGICVVFLIILSKIIYGIQFRFQVVQGKDEIHASSVALPWAAFFISLVVVMIGSLSFQAVDALGLWPLMQQRTD